MLCFSKAVEPGGVGDGVCDLLENPAEDDRGESNRGRFPNMPESELLADLLVGTSSDSSCFSLSRDLHNSRIYMKLTMSY